MTEAENNRYQLLDVAGRGGMSTVYRARDRTAQMDVAIKVLHEHLIDDPGMVEAFEREARLMQQIDEPGVVRVFGTTAIEGRPAIVMEYCPGETLDVRLAGRGRFDENQALDVLIPILKTLDALHDQGIVHRDVKPQNILFDADERPRLIDFGIGRADELMEVEDAGQVGTVEYMAPERIDGLTVDGRSDLYSAAVVLFELVCGHPPYRADAASAVMRMHRRAEIPDPQTFTPDLSKRVRRVIQKALSKYPEQRFDTAADVIAALRGDDDVVDDIEDHPVWRTLQQTYGGESTMVAPVEREGHEWVVFAVDYDRFRAQEAEGLAEIIDDNIDHLAVQSGPIRDVVDVMRTGTTVDDLLESRKAGDEPADHRAVKWRQLLGAYGIARGMSRKGAERLVARLEDVGIVARLSQRRRRRREPTKLSGLFNPDSVAAALLAVVFSGAIIYSMAARQLAATGGPMSPGLMAGFLAICALVAVTSSWAASAGMIAELWRSNFSRRYLLDFCRTRSEIAGDVSIGRQHVELVDSIQSPRIAASVERALNMALHLRDWLIDHDLGGTDKIDDALDAVTALGRRIVDVEATVAAIRPGEVASRIRQLESRIDLSEDIEETEAMMEQKSQLRRRLQARDRAQQRLQTLGQRLLDVATGLEKMVHQYRHQQSRTEPLAELPDHIEAATAEIEELTVLDFDVDVQEQIDAKRQVVEPKRAPG